MGAREEDQSEVGENASAEHLREKNDHGMERESTKEGQKIQRFENA